VPRYDYRCNNCKNEFELVQSFSEAGSGTCPVCSGSGQRVYHAVPVIYKGSGFYTTDYGRPKRTNEDTSTDTSSKDSKEGKDAKQSKDAKESKTATASTTNGAAEKSEPASKTTSETPAAS